MPKGSAVLLSVKEQNTLGHLQAGSSMINFHLLDMPGKRELMALNLMHIRDTHAAIILHDVTNAESLGGPEKWIEESKEAAPSAVQIVLVGNKMETPQA